MKQPLAIEDLLAFAPIHSFLSPMDGLGYDIITRAGKLGEPMQAPFLEEVYGPETVTYFFKEANRSVETIGEITYSLQTSEDGVPLSGEGTWDDDKADYAKFIEELAQRLEKLQTLYQETGAK